MSKPPRMHGTRAEWNLLGKYDHLSFPPLGPDERPPKPDPDELWRKFSLDDPAARTLAVLFDVESALYPEYPPLLLGPKVLNRNNIQEEKEFTGIFDLYRATYKYHYEMQDDWKRREAEFSQYDPRIEATTDEELASDESLAPVLNRESFQLCFHAMLDEKGDLFACVVKDGIDPVGRSADWLHMDIEWLYSWRERLGRDPWRDRFPPPDYSFKTITVANWRLVLDRVAGLVAEQTWILWLVKCFDEDLRIANAPLEPGTFLKEGLSNIILIQVIASFLSEEAQKAAEASKAGKSARGKKGRRKVENETMKVANVAKVTKAAPGRVDAYELEHILRRNMVPGREFRARIKKLAAAEVKMYPSLVRIRFDENGIPLPPNDFLVPAAAGKYLDD